MRKQSSFLFDLASFDLLLVAGGGRRRRRRTAEKQRLGFACLGKWDGKNMGGMGWVDVKVCWVCWNLTCAHTTSGDMIIRRYDYDLPTSMQACLFAF